MSTDFLTYTDWNRIANNIQVVNDLFVGTGRFPDLEAAELNPSQYGNYSSSAAILYAGPMNYIEDSLDTINTLTAAFAIGDKRTFVPTGTALTFDELNRLESATLRLYEFVIGMASEITPRRGGDTPALISDDVLSGALL